MTVFTSPYIARPRRTLAEAERDLQEKHMQEPPMRERDRGYMPDSRAVYWLQRAISEAGMMVASIAQAEQHMETGTDCSDQLSQIADIVADLRFKIERLQLR